MKRLLTILCVILGVAFMSYTAQPIEQGSDSEVATLHDVEQSITQQHILEMPVEIPVTYSGGPSVVVSSTYCRALGKFRLNTIIPIISELAPLGIQIKSSKFLGSSSPHYNFSYAIDYYIYEQRRILI